MDAYFRQIVVPLKQQQLQLPSLLPSVHDRARNCLWFQSLWEAYLQLSDDENNHSSQEDDENDDDATLDFLFQQEDDSSSSRTATTASSSSSSSPFHFNNNIATIMPTDPSLIGLERCLIRKVMSAGGHSQQLYHPHHPHHRQDSYNVYHYHRRHRRHNRHAYYEHERCQEKTQSMLYDYVCNSDSTLTQFHAKTSRQASRRDRVLARVFAQMAAAAAAAADD